MAITTVYDGIEYRSRLEARWAAFMRNIGWEIVYEPFDGDGYIPDFLVQGPRPMLVEVKPAVTLAEYRDAIPKAEKGLAAHWNHDILIVGASPTPPASFNSNSGVDNYPAGWLGEWYNGDFTQHPGWAWDSAAWGNECSCHGISVYHTIMSYVGRPCGCYDGNIPYLSNRRLLESFWADACNDVKWRGTDGRAQKSAPRREPKPPSMPKPTRGPRRLSDIAPAGNVRPLRGVAAIEADLGSA